MNYSVEISIAAQHQSTEILSLHKQTNGHKYIILLCTLNLILSINRTLCMYTTSVFTYIVCGEEGTLVFTERHNIYIWINTPDCVNIKNDNIQWKYSILKYIYQYSIKYTNAQITTQNNTRASSTIENSNHTKRIQWHKYTIYKKTL